MGYYPVFLELDQRPCLVIGGGSVALQKVSGLLIAGARVTVVSPDLRAELNVMLQQGQITHIPREYEAGDLEGMTLVMVATDDGAVNRQAAEDCRKRRIWVNASDDPPNCDFILPSVVRKGKITLAASTSGTSPALARRLREELDVYLSDDFEPLADLLAEVRQDLRARRIVVDADTWQHAIDGQLRALLAQRRYGQARARLLAGLGIELRPIVVDEVEVPEPVGSASSG
ncbi:MAG: precorrin-2 dehydrogenase/sirohydrochlorin ferrochelatase family protein [Dehalococcoidia bacterium]